MLEVPVSKEELRELRDIALLSYESEAILDGATLSDGIPLLKGTWDDFDELVGCIAAEANHETRRKRRRILDQVWERVEGALSERQEHGART